MHDLTFEQITKNVELFYDIGITKKPENYIDSNGRIYFDIKNNKKEDIKIANPLRINQLKKHENNFLVKNEKNNSSNSYLSQILKLQNKIINKFQIKSDDFYVTGHLTDVIPAEWFIYLEKIIIKLKDKQKQDDIYNWFRKRAIKNNLTYEYIGKINKQTNYLSIELEFYM